MRRFARPLFATLALIGAFYITAYREGSRGLWLDVNGERMQTGSTRTMIFGVAHLVSYVSRFVTLLPGDVITTGTPPGVGMGKKPPRYLTPGDVVTLGIAGLGAQQQTCVAWKPTR